MLFYSNELRFQPDGKQYFTFMFDSWCGRKLTPLLILA